MGNSIKTSQDIAYFIARMGHEIRTPINAIKGFGDILLAETVGPLNEKQSEYMKKMIINSEKLLDIINQILDWARLEAGQVNLRLEKINLYSLMLEVLSLFEIQAMNKKIHLEIKGDKNIIIEGDMTKLRQVLINLVSNALKFTPEHGKITLGFNDNGDKIQVFVKDTGIGIPETKIKTIFEPFDQGPQLQIKDKGFGLGLWICKSIIQLHQGQIWIDSQINKGTTIFFEIP